MCNSTLSIESASTTGVGTLVTFRASTPGMSAATLAGSAFFSEVSVPERALPIDTHTRFSATRIDTKMGEPGSCEDTHDALCLLDGRFRATVRWLAFDGREGVGSRVTIPSDDSGLFTFFTPSNWEMLVKVIDGCTNNGRFWVFGAATTNVAYELTVTDTVTGETRVYQNPLGTSAPAIVDTQAFASCS